jgi:cell division protein FtsB
MDIFMQLFDSFLNQLITNQVILPVIISALVAYFTLRRANASEEDENFIRLKEQFRQLWSEVIDNDKLDLSVEETKDEITKLHSFQIVEFFYLVWFLNYRRRSPYRKQWNQNLDHAFKHTLIKSTFKKHAKSFDPEYQIFIYNRFNNLE